MEGKGKGRNGEERRGQKWQGLMGGDGRDPVGVRKVMGNKREDRDASGQLSYC